MKKLLAILAATALITPVVTSVVSCGETEESMRNNPLLIGKGIDKSKAIDDSQPGKYGFTNFYIVGDSLSDTDGISNLIKTKFANSLVDLNVSLSGAYGYEKNNTHYSAFSNGMTAGTILSEKLGFGEMKPSNFLSKKEESNYGKNYSVGGATAAKLDLPTGILLNDATIDRQTEALISQHKINNNDLVFFEIGGNDLFSLIGFYGNEAKQTEFMKDSVDRVRTALFNLLNNGIKNIIFMTPPRMDFPPRYRHVFEDAKKPENLEAQKKADFIINICNEYYSKIMNVLNEVELYYPDSIQLYDLFKKTDELEKQFKDLVALDGSEAIINEAYSNGQSIEVNLNNEKVKFNTNPNVDLLQNISGVINEFKGDIVFGAKNTLDITISATRNHTIISDRDEAMKNYFFTDFVHPTKEVHRLVSDILLGYAKELSKKWEN
ncbi:SGNH/GDSL hydrolase family protein [Mesoplasma coleopterae]|uniref:SGNH/GDSL hydrolase family protein n=1 Tax=Mesoplasma coleopterae TaxID=324078 RepID=UPI000D044655|nr:SGNH/GDSL hydrolase family protein [Mesoplasma coleopterae]AVN63041.1 hypothetical protein CG000_01840 [Mesoplasma coleopterae]